MLCGGTVGSGSSLVTRIGRRQTPASNFLRRAVSLPGGLLAGVLELHSLYILGFVGEVEVRVFSMMRVVETWFKEGESAGLSGGRGGPFFSLDI